MRSTGRSRREEVIIYRLRFGHTGLNNTLLIIGKHNRGKCEHCGEEETINRVILQCQKYQVERRKLIQNLRKMKMKLDLIDFLRTRKVSIIRFYFRFSKRVECLGGFELHIYIFFIIIIFLIRFCF